VRLVDHGGRLEVTELFIAQDHVTGSTLREVPLGRIEAIANNPKIKPALLEHIVREADQVAEEMYAQFADLVPEGWQSFRPARRPRLRLRIPTSRRKPNEFYMQVADAFGWLSQSSARPAQDLAETNNVPVSTVHRWVKEARRRGYLGPASGSKEQ
jgi:hypothetical protein